MMEPDRKPRRWQRIRTTGVLFNNLKPIARDESLDPPDNACFNCWEPGHTRRACPHEIVPGAFCHNCGRLEKVMATCPRCSEAYAVWAKNQDVEKYGTLILGPETVPEPGVPDTPLIDLNVSLHPDFRDLDQDLFSARNTELEQASPPAESVIDQPLPSSTSPPAEVVSPIQAGEILPTPQTQDPPFGQSDLPPGAQDAWTRVWEQMQILSNDPSALRKFVRGILYLVGAELPAQDSPSN